MKNVFIILTPGFPKSEMDTTCLPMQQAFVKTLHREYPSITPIVLSFQYPYNTGSYEWYGIRVMSFDGRNRGGFTKWRLRRQIAKVLTSILQDNNIKGLLSFWTNECAWIGTRFARKNGLVHFSWILGQDATKENRYPQQIRFESRELVALSDSLQHEFERNHAVRPKYVVAAGVDETLFQKKNITQTVDILGVGSLRPLKRYNMFLQVVAAVKEKFPNVAAILVGKGPEEQHLRKTIDALNLEANVKLTGELSYPDVLHLMQCSRVFLHPSYYEGFSGVCLEALAAGCQVVSFCKPMEHEIPNWSIVPSQIEMTQVAIKMLEHLKFYNQPFSFSIEQSVFQMMTLFDISR